MAFDPTTDNPTLNLSNTASQLAAVERNAAIQIVREGRLSPAALGELARARQDVKDAYAKWAAALC